jgi:hypothetical protein
MIDQIGKVLDYTTQYITSIPAHSWYVVGSLIVASGVTFWAVNLIKSHHLRVKAEELSKKFVQLNLAFWGLVTAAAAFIVTNGTNIDALSSFAPFIKQYVPTVMVFATFLYTYGGNGLYKQLAAKLQAWATQKSEPIVSPVPATPATTTADDMFTAE